MTNDNVILRQLLYMFMSIRIKIMFVKMVLGLSMLIIGSVIVATCGWLIPTFNIYSNDSVIYIASIFMVYYVIETLLLSKNILTPASVLSIGLVLPPIILYAILKRKNPLGFMKSTLTTIQHSMFYKSDIYNSINRRSVGE